MKNIAVIVAHSDDETISMGGTIYRLIKEGKNVSVLFVSNSFYNNFRGEVHRTVEQAIEETKSCMNYLGVKNYGTLGYDTKNIPYNSELVEDIDRYITENKIDTIFTHAPDDFHQDHKNVGQAVLSAARRVNNIYLFEPMFPAKSTTLFHPNLYIDINGYMPNKLEALKLHRSQYEKYGDKWLEIATHLAKVRGLESGVENAEAFCVIKQSI